MSDQGWEGPERRTDRPETVAELRSVRTSIVAVATAMDGLAGALSASVRDSSRSNRRWLRALTLAVLALVVISGGLVFVGLQNTQRIQESEAARSLILDCTQPTGECYQQSAARQAVVIQQLVTEVLTRGAADRTEQNKRQRYQLECDLTDRCREGYEPGGEPPPYTPSLTTTTTTQPAPS